MATLVAAVAERSDAVIGTTIVSRNPMIACSHWLQLADRHIDNIRKLADKFSSGSNRIRHSQKTAAKKAATDTRGTKMPPDAGQNSSVDTGGGDITYEQYDNKGFVPVGLFANSVVPAAKFLDLKQEGFGYDTVVIKKAMRKVLNGGTGGLFDGHSNANDAEANSQSSGSRS